MSRRTTSGLLVQIPLVAIVMPLVYQTLACHMNRTLLLPALVPPAGCAHFEDRPIDPPSNPSAFEARTLADPGLMAFVEETRLITNPEGYQMIIFAALRHNLPCGIILSKYTPGTRSVPGLKQVIG